MKYNIYQSLQPLLNLFYSNQWGAWGLVPLSYASDSGAARNLSGFVRICQEGAKARERSERGEGAVPPSDGREIFENLGMKS